MGRRDLSHREMDAVQDAVVALDTTGFDVTRIINVERTRDGVEIELAAMVNTRTKSMEDD